MNQISPIQIGNHWVGPGFPCLIVAEISANHRQDYQVALQSVRAAAKSGANAVKFQTYTPDSITLQGEQEWFQIKHDTHWDGRSLYDLYAEAYMPWEWHSDLQKAAHEEGLLFFSSPFDPSAVDFLEQLNVPVYKIASPEITDIPLIEKVASTGKPVIISTGVARLEDIEKAVRACHRQNNSQIILLKCTSAYPAPLEESNLKTIPQLSQTFSCLSGFSDHTLSPIPASVAVSLGACLIEKHFIFDKQLGGPDAFFSLDPHEFSQLVEVIRETEKVLGKICWELTPKATISKNFARSLFVIKKVSAGETISLENVRSLRPFIGLSPEFLPEILGKKFRTDLDIGTPLNWNHIETN